MTEDCAICAEKRKSFVVCPKCQFSSCKSCTKKFLLECPDINPKCMSCKAQWDFEFLAENTDDDFHNKTYREYRCKIILQREKSLLPATQPFVDDAKKLDILEKKIEENNKEMKKLRARMRDLLDEQKDLRDEVHTIRGMAGENKVTHKTEFIGHCPEQDCKGFLDTEYTCGMCKKTACRKCRETEHEGACNPDTVKTVKALAKDTKKCPNCGVPIYKIEGCDQMFCMSCHTAFSWTTGKIETGRVHNPHYYQWQRETGGEMKREQGDVPCGGQISYYTLLTRLRRSGQTEKVIQWCANSHELSGHIRAVVLPKFAETDIGDVTNRDLRIQFLIDNITEKEWLREIKRREKKREKNRAISLALVMFANTLDDLHGNIAKGKIEDVSMYLVEMKSLRKYISTVFDKIEKRFDNKAPTVSPDWKIRLPGQKERKTADARRY